MENSIVHTDPWQELKSHTSARIALGRAGSSLPTQEVLQFNLAHALARDAVHIPLDTKNLEEKLHAHQLETIQVHSQANDRSTFLLRPDLGRTLNESSREILLSQRNKQALDFLIVVGDGLSSIAIERHAEPMICEIMSQRPAQWKIGKIVIAQQARVALADEIAELLNAKMVAILIGERPGLSSPDSLGIYLTYNPHKECSDADRNCISNIRPEGLDYATAAKKLVWLACEATQLKRSGVNLKDESDIKSISSPNKCI